MSGAIVLAVIESHRDLIVWQKAIALVFEIYRLSRAFPADERFGLTAQMRRAVLSVPGNIAEGHGRNNHRAEYRRFLSMARGSLKEVETYLVIAHGLRFVNPGGLERAESLCDEISRMLNAMQQKLRRRRRKEE